MIAGYFILYQFDWKNLGAQGLSVFSLIANFKMWQLAGNYWAPAAHETPLLHTWSLAVEEQFYIFYPLLLIAILKFAKKRAFKLILVGTVLSFIIGFLATLHSPAAAFYLLPARAWELAAGCLLAMLTHRHIGSFGTTKYAPLLSMLGIVAIAASYCWINAERGFPGYQALIPVIGTLLVLAFSTKDNLTGRMLASVPVCYVGKISYSLYLWHWPVIVYAHIIYQQTQFAVPLYALVTLI
jgi:peptidoglycan/LPS O-acetylase OafA/YrhL